MNQPPFSFTYRVPYSDCTVGNHVYYARYLDWLERARNEFFRRIGVTFQSLVDQGIMLPVVTSRAPMPTQLNCIVASGFIQRLQPLHGRID